MWTPLRKAARSGSDRMVSLLLKRKADPKMQNQQALVTACAWGHRLVVQLLIDHKSDLGSDELNWEQSPLALAAQYGHVHICRALLNGHANVNYVDELGNDPLIVAWNYNQEEIVFFLVERGAILKNLSDWERLAQVSVLVF